MSKIIALDVDLTVVDSLFPWLIWYQKNTGVEYRNIVQDGQYDLVPKMAEHAKKNGIDFFDAFAYWRQPDLYDEMTPYEGASQFIYDAKRLGHEIVFVSHCHPAHEESKRKFLRRFYGNLPFISTKDKYLVRYDLIVDDNVEVIQTCLKNNPGFAAQKLTDCSRKAVAGVPFAFEEWDDRSNDGLLSLI